MTPSLHRPPSLTEIATLTDDLRDSVQHGIGVDRSKFQRAILACFLSTNEVPDDQKILHITNDFFDGLSLAKKLIDGDIQAALRNDPAARSDAEVIAYYPGLRAVVAHRIASALHRRGVPLLPRGMAEVAHRETGIDIHPGATIGEEFFIDHGTGVVIGETSSIGNRVTLYQGVTLGALSFRYDEDGKVRREEKRHPTVEDDVVIYANATILGGKTVIGRGSVIGGSVWLRESVPPGSIVTLEPPAIRLRTRTEKL